MINYRLFTDETFEVDPGVTIIIGRNDTGKSTVLAALDLYRKVTKESFRIEGDTDETDASELEVLWDVDGVAWKHRVTLDSANPVEIVRSGEREWRWNPRKKIFINPQGAQFELEDVKRLTPLGRIDWKTQTGFDLELVTELSSSLARFQLHTPYLFEPTALGEPTLDTSFGREPLRSGHYWSNWLQAIINRRDDNIARIDEKLREMFPHVAKVMVREGPDGVQFSIIPIADLQPMMDLARAGRSLVSAREVQYEVSAHCQQKIVPASAVSSGILLATAHFACSYAHDKGAILMLEEPENGLNHQIVFKMMESFLEIVRSRDQQLILTTHNEWWLDLVKPAQIRVLTRDESGGHIQTANADVVKQLKGDGLYPSEAVAIRGPEALLGGEESK
jgi:energy-coupling factor transporter ATP-binding protein EcfA2